MVRSKVSKETTPLKGEQARAKVDEPKLRAEQAHAKDNPLNLFCENQGCNAPGKPHGYSLWPSGQQVVVVLCDKCAGEMSYKVVTA